MRLVPVAPLKTVLLPRMNGGNPVPAVGPGRPVMIGTTGADVATTGEPSVLVEEVITLTLVSVRVFVLKRVVVTEVVSSEPLEKEVVKLVSTSAVREGATGAEPVTSLLRVEDGAAGIGTGILATVTVWELVEWMMIVSSAEEEVTGTFCTISVLA